jgi:hypothetical protein
MSNDEEDVDDRRGYSRLDRLSSNVETLKADIRQMRSERESDLRIQDVYHKDTVEWRIEMKVRIDTFSKTLEDIKIDLASRDAKQSSPITAALSAAGGGGGALLIYLMAKAIGLIPGGLG